MRNERNICRPKRSFGEVAGRIFAVVLTAFLALLLLQNLEPITLELALLSFTRPLAALFFVSLLIGFALGMLFVNARR